MTNDNDRFTPDNWSVTTARAIMQAAKKQAGKEGADVAMIHVGKLFVSLLFAVEIEAQNQPGYPGPSGWMDLIADYVADRLATDK